MEYLGHLSACDPLFDYLRYEIMPQIGGSGRKGFRVFGCHSSHAVYIYEDRESGARAVGKFFSVPDGDFDRARRKMYHEYNNINEFRKYLGDCHYTARALGCNENLNCLLITEYCFGETLDEVIMRAIQHNDSKHLYSKLSALANFLATVHNRSAQAVMVDFHKVCNYFEHVVAQLSFLADHNERYYLKSLCDKYRRMELMYQDQEVLVHGDATPANFFFGEGSYVITFDLERMQRTDRVFDVGRIAGELKHYFLRCIGSKYASEPYIGHFLYEYCGGFPDRMRAFHSIASRLPFYMGLNLLRIARNSYLPMSYKRQLIEEAKCILE